MPDKKIELNRYEQRTWASFQRFMKQLKDATCEGEWPAIAQVAATLTAATATTMAADEICAEMPSAGRGI